MNNPAKLFLADISSSSLRDTLALLPPEAVAYATALDTASSSACRDFVLDAIKKEGRIDGAVLCAGAPPAGLPLKNTSDEALMHHLSSTVLSAFATARAIAGLPVSQTPSTSLVLLSSAVALNGAPELAAYATAKAALIGLAKSLAKELGPRGMRVNALAPAHIEAESEPGSPSSRSRTPMRRMGQPEEVASAAAFLLGGDSSFVNGTVMEVDGGR